jgi:hypothetical protein
MLLGPNLDAGRLGEVMEGLPGLVLGKLGAMEIGADIDAAIGGSSRKTSNLRSQEPAENARRMYVYPARST